MLIKAEQILNAFLVKTIIQKECCTMLLKKIIACRNFRLVPMSIGLSTELYFDRGTSDGIIFECMR